MGVMQRLGIISPVMKLSGAILPLGGEVPGLSCTVCSCPSGGQGILQKSEQ